MVGGTDSRGGEGMVVKPLEFRQGRKGFTARGEVPGREYLRIIYGPEYTLSANLGGLRAGIVRSGRWR